MSDKGKKSPPKQMIQESFVSGIAAALSNAKPAVAAKPQPSASTTTSKSPKKP